jgi:hypothetical protein
MITFKAEPHKYLCFNMHRHGADAFTDSIVFVLFGAPMRDRGEDLCVEAHAREDTGQSEIAMPIVRTLRARLPGAGHHVQTRDDF